MGDRRSVMLSVSITNNAEASLAANQPPTPTTNVQYYNKPNTGESFILTSFRPEQNAITPGHTAKRQPSSLSRTFEPHRGGEGNNQDYQIGSSVTFDVENHVALETSVPGAGHEATIQQLDQKTETNTLRKNEVVAGTFQETQYSEDYLQPVESENQYSTR